MYIIHKARKKVNGPFMDHIKNEKSTHHYRFSSQMFSSPIPNQSNKMRGRHITARTQK